MRKKYINVKTEKDKNQRNEDMHCYMWSTEKKNEIPTQKTLI